VTDGRRGVCMVNHCMHDPDAIIGHVADWRPFAYITLRYDVAGLDGGAWTYQFDRLDEGTRLMMRMSDPGGDGVWATAGPDLVASVDDEAEQLEAVLAATAV
jgi:hypothetical protein